MSILAKVRAVEHHVSFPSENAGEMKSVMFGHKRISMNSIITPQREARNEARRLIAREVTRRYENELNDAGLVRRFVIWMKIQKEVAKELKRKFPPHALYVQRFAR